MRQSPDKLSPSLSLLHYLLSESLLSWAVDSQGIHHSAHPRLGDNSPFFGRLLTECFFLFQSKRSRAPSEKCVRKMFFTTWPWVSVSFLFPKRTAIEEKN